MSAGEAATGEKRAATVAETSGTEFEAPAGSPAELTERTINTIRTLAMDAVQAAQSGHPGTPMGLAPLAYALWTHGMKYDSADPAWPDRDRFVLSCGHASMLLYAMLHLTRYDLAHEDIVRFRQLGSPAAGHPELGEIPGVETTTGPLGQGFGNAVGMALAEGMLAARFNTPESAVVDHRTWVMASDGDLMEGVASEAASLAGHLGLGKLCVFYDDNKITIDGGTDLSFSEDVARRFEGYGWHVLRVHVDEGVGAYCAAIDAAIAETARPTLVICRTHIGHGSPGKQDRAAAHGAPLGEEEVAATKAVLGWPTEARFLVPPEVEAHMTEAGRRGSAARTAWHDAVAARRAASPEAMAALEAAWRGDLPAGWEEHLPDMSAGGAGAAAMATRKASGLVLAALADVLPLLVGGSADLAGSNKTTMPGAKDVAAGALDGRTIHFGVREHAMGAVLNGLALHGGLRGYGGTFLVFSDYMRPSIRLAALMKLPVIYVFTHDSIGVGEDGPTHQPIEHLAALRAMPGLHVVRPGDAAETVAAWRHALGRRDGPTALVLTRQGVPVLDRARLAPASGLARGAYVLREGAVAPDVVLMATGSEVALALAAAERLQGEGIAARVVSAPCLDVLAERPTEEIEALWSGCQVRVAVEAACSFGWHRWIGPAGALVTLDRFGASGPAGDLFPHFGFTPERVAEVARQALAAVE